MRSRASAVTILSKKVQVQSSVSDPMCGKAGRGCQYHQIGGRWLDGKLANLTGVAAEAQMTGIEDLGD
jgi:ribosomal protein S2